MEKQNRLQNEFPQQQQQYPLPLAPLSQPPCAPPQASVQPIVIHVASPQRSTKKYPSYKSSLSLKLGVIQLVFGGLAFMLNAVGLAMNTHYVIYDYTDDESYSSYSFEVTYAYYSNTGIWCTVFFALSGAFAICSAKRKTFCMIVTHMVLSIIASVFAVLNFGMAGWALGQEIDRLASGLTYTVYPFRDSNTYGSDEEYEVKNASAATERAKGMLALASLFFVVSIAEVVACIWSSTLCCGVICCGESSHAVCPPVQYVAGTSASVQPQVMIVDAHGRPIHGARMIQVAAAGTGGYVPNDPGQLGYTPPPQYSSQGQPTESVGDIAQGGGTVPDTTTNEGSTTPPPPYHT